MQPEHCSPKDSFRRARLCAIDWGHGSGARSAASIPGRLSILSASWGWRTLMSPALLNGVLQVVLKQQCIKAGIKQSDVAAADLAIANFFYANAISFSAAST